MESLRYSKLQKEASKEGSAFLRTFLRTPHRLVQSCPGASSAFPARALPASIVQCSLHCLRSPKLSAGCPPRKTQHLLRGLEKAEVRSNKLFGGGKRREIIIFQNNFGNKKCYSMLLKWHWSSHSEETENCVNFLILALQFNTVSLCHTWRKGITESFSTHGFQNLHRALLCPIVRGPLARTKPGLRSTSDSLRTKPSALYPGGLVSISSHPQAPDFVSKCTRAQSPILPCFFISYQIINSSRSSALPHRVNPVKPYRIRRKRKRKQRKTRSS